MSFNADLLGTDDSVIATDTSGGVTNGQTFSTLKTFLAPGNYKLLVTANSTGPATRYRIDVADGGEVPAFVPIPVGGEPPLTPVPLPATGLMFASGVLTMAAGRRSRARALRQA